MDRGEYCTSTVHSLAFVAHMLAHSDGLGLCIAVMTQRLVLVTDESRVGQLFVAVFATEAVWMPVRGHRLDHSTDDELAAFIAAGREQHLEVSFAVLATLELVEDSVRERAEALGASKRGGWGLFTKKEFI